MQTDKQKYQNSPNTPEEYVGELVLPTIKAEQRATFGQCDRADGLLSDPHTHGDGGRASNTGERKPGS